jgi:molybdopterin-guanine dinucleotide biosynthesis protein A
VAYTDVTGVLLVGGASRRFGAPKALVEFMGEPLAERAYRTLRATFPNVLAIGKAEDRFPLSFPVVDDASSTRAAIVGVAGALRAAETDLCVILPTDMPFVTPALLRLLADAAEDADAAVSQAGPLPGAYSRSALPTLERRIAAGDLALHRALADLATRDIVLNPELLRNVNTPEDLDALKDAPVTSTTGAAGGGFPWDAGSRT